MPRDVSPTTTAGTPTLNGGNAPSPPRSALKKSPVKRSTALSPSRGSGGHHHQQDVASAMIAAAPSAVLDAVTVTSLGIPSLGAPGLTAGGRSGTLRGRSHLHHHQQQQLDDPPRTILPIGGNNGSVVADPSPIEGGDNVNDDGGAESRISDGATTAPITLRNIGSPRISASQQQPQHQMALSAIEAEDTEQVVTQLLELEGGLSLLLEQVKRNQNSAKDLVSFFKKRAVIEEEYGKSMQKLCHSLTESVDRDEGKCRESSFSDCIRQMAEIHGSVASNRLALATHVAQVGEELASVMKDSDRSRRQLKDSGERFEKQLSTAESLLDKARGKQETTNDAWERAKAVVDGIAAGAPVPPASGAAGLFFGMARANPDRDEEDARHRAARANDGYQTQLAATIRARAEFQSTHLPTLLRSLKEVNDEGDVALQYHLSKYAFHYEQVLAADASSLCPALPIAATAAAPNGGASSSAVGRSVGIRKLFEAMDHAGDLQAAIVKATAAAANNGGGMVSGSMSPTRDGVAASLTTGARSTSHSPNGGSGALSSLSLVGTPARPMFGLSLMELAERDDTDTPRLLVAVTRLVEEIGLETVSVYRQPGNHMAVQKLRALCDRDFDSLTWIASAPLGDIPALTSLVKLFLRSLSDSLLPRALHREFLTAAKTADSRSQLLAIHDLVNRLPDPHYATLRHLMLHLDRIAQHAGRNRMSWVNLSIVFGPCLMHSGAAAAAATGALAAGENALAAAANPATGKDKDGGNGSGSGGSGSVKESTEMHFQCKVVELILKHSRVIFEA